MASAADASAHPHAGPPLSPSDAYRWLALPVEDLLRHCRQSRFQGSGPGGQKRNRVYSGVRVTHAGTGLTAESVDSRASLRNLHAALGRLRLNLALSAAIGDRAPENEPAACLAAMPQPPFRPGANPDHEDYPRLLLRALHLLAWHGGQLAPAAAALDCTASALTRFFKADKAAWTKAREIREANGLHPLK
jgi:hypothetical protein